MKKAIVLMIKIKGFKNPKISYVFDKKLFLSIICDK